MTDTANFDAVTRYLDAMGVAYEVIEHTPTFTANEDARVTGTASTSEAKAVLLRSDGDYRLAVVPASERVDLHKVHELVDLRAVLRLATEAEMGSDFRQFEVGALPPLGPMLPAPELLDRRLLDCDRIVCSGGDHRHSLRLDPRDIMRLANPLVADLCED
jgi:Ala-tRNA(Pro) deacylase